MKLRRVLFLASYTPRSQAYAQVLAQADLHPEYSVFFGAENSGLSGQSAVISTNEKISGLFMPDFSEPLEKTVFPWESKIHKIREQNVNSPLIYEHIKRIKPRLVIYSGYGGQIVNKKLLHTGATFLHIHSGWLPDYKGSTTLYYSWLKENWCGVSAIILNEQIDEGRIVARKKYAPPSKGVDSDYVYDSAIRAELLVSVLNKYVQEGGLTSGVPQKEEGETYFVIHPVLKHLARLRVDN